jgi:S-adenosylmethionine decarboxylase proenzyme|tara:strand:+ start:1042 stop:1410 length:369 start_codon:yes stop_codon:yes gene_type:complete
MKNGKHLIIDAYGCNRNLLWDVRGIEAMLLDITEMIGLKPLSDVLIYEVDETMIELKDTGVTGGIIFMESHFTFHAFPEQNYFSADIYSCKDFDHQDVIDYISEMYEPQELKETVILRGTSL